MKIKPQDSLKIIRRLADEFEDQFNKPYALGHVYRDQLREQAYRQLKFLMIKDIK